MLADVYTCGPWLLLVRGVTAGSLAILVLRWRHLDLSTLALLFGTYALVEGTAVVISATFARRADTDRRLLTLQGLAGIAIGFVVLGHPSMTASYLLLQMVLRAVAIGGIDCIAGLVWQVEARSGRLLLLLCGIAPALAGTLVLARLGTGAQAAIWYLAISSLIASVLLLVLAGRRWTCADRRWGQHRRRIRLPAG